MGQSAQAQKTAESAINKDDDDDAAIEAKIAAELAKLQKFLSEWRRQTPAEKAAWHLEHFETEEPFWKGEVAYDEGEDLDFEDQLREAMEERKG